MNKRTKWLAVAALAATVIAAHASVNQCDCLFQVRSTTVEGSAPSVYRIDDCVNGIKSTHNAAWTNYANYVGICRGDTIYIEYPTNAPLGDTTYTVIETRSGVDCQGVITWLHTNTCTMLRDTCNAVFYTAASGTGTNCDHILWRGKLIGSDVKAVPGRSPSLTMNGSFSDTFIAAFDAQTTTPYVVCANSVDHEPTESGWWHGNFTLCTGDYVCFVGSSAPFSSPTALSDAWDFATDNWDVATAPVAPEVWFRVDNSSGQPDYVLEYPTSRGESSSMSMSLQSEGAGNVPPELRARVWEKWYSDLLSK